MKRSEFWQRMRAQFGADYADSVARDQVLAGLGGRTVQEAFEAGVSAREIWRQVCDSFDVPARDR